MSREARGRGSRHVVARAANVIFIFMVSFRYSKKSLEMSKKHDHVSSVHSNRRSLSVENQWKASFS